MAQKESGALGEKLELVVRDGKTGELKRHIVVYNGKCFDLAAIYKNMSEYIDLLLRWYDASSKKRN